jgi:hypothetical protein
MLVSTVANAGCKQEVTMKRLSHLTPEHGFRSVKKGLLIAGLALLLSLALGIGGVVVVWNLITERLPQWINASEQGVTIAIDQADHSLADKMQSLAPSLTDQVVSALGWAPAHDVGGEDIAHLSRYPGMVRTTYRDINGRRTVTYRGRADLAEVVRFYRDEAQRQGWTVTVLEANPVREVYSLMRGGHEVLLTCSRSLFGNLLTVTLEER